MPFEYGTALFLQAQELTELGGNNAKLGFSKLLFLPKEDVRSQSPKKLATLETMLPIAEAIQIERVEVISMRSATVLGILACSLLAGQSSPQTAAPVPVVKIHSGKVRGSLTGSGGAAFKGIPYAQPPTGELRWKEPVPVKPWTGIREATAFGRFCVQGGPGGPGSVEDCLYLNVWTPRWPVPSPLPVMVWIHGGGNVAGSTADPVYDGESLARHGVIVVSMNYRLGVFGFLALPELSRESPHHVSGNYGLLDQILALRWVHENVTSFGGDPANVTIFGESAGSADVNALLSSPLSKGLFRRAIGESGPASDLPSLAEAEKKGEEMVRDLKISGESELHKLRAIRSDEIQKAIGSSMSPSGRTHMVGTVVDGWVLPESPMKVFASGKEQRVPLLLGSNSQELQKPFFPISESLTQAITDQYGPLADRAMELYGLKSETEPPADPKYGPVLAQWATDSQFRCGTIAELIWHTEAGNPGYQFQFSRAMPGKEALGAPHGSELAYVFGTLDRAPKPTTYAATDRKISEKMQQYWTNFAKTGDPNDATLPTWPKFDAEARMYLDFASAGPVAEKGLRRDICDLYMENLKRTTISPLKEEK